MAVYDTSRGGADKSSFGKMTASARGPKGTALHAANLNLPTSPDGCDKFVSVGEKHLCFWTMKRSQGKASASLTFEAGKLGPHKNKQLMCAAAAGKVLLLLL